MVVEVGGVATEEVVTVVVAEGAKKEAGVAVLGEVERVAATSRIQVACHRCSPTRLNVWQEKHPAVRQISKKIA